MRDKVQITFRSVDHSEALQAEIDQRAADLCERFPRITRCRVTVEAPTLHHRHGLPYHVSIRVSIPGKELVANRSPDTRGDHEDPYLAVRDAFRTAARELERHTDRSRTRLQESAG